MFIEVLLFEIRYRLRRPGCYIYFFSVLFWTIFTYSKGMVPTQEKELYNAPAALALNASLTSIFLMFMSAFFLGVALYRDIEHGVREYYLSYPITKPGYFWGRFLGSFFFVALTGAAAMIGPWIGSLLGPVFGQSAERYGANHLYYYLQPYFTLVLPNLFFTSCIFFGLVAIFRTVKVAYAGALLLFLGYLIANFFLNTIRDASVIYLADPFAFNGLRMQLGSWSAQELNSSVVPLSGLLLKNRLLWVSIGLVIILSTYWRFSFHRFFREAGSKKKGVEEAPRGFELAAMGRATISFAAPYHRRTLLNLTKIELLNMVRDAYFWIILVSGWIFIGFVFFHGPGAYGINDYPRTVFFVDVFGDKFMFFLFFLLLFYTGESVHREKLTRYNLINDTLPPATWVLNAAKLLSLLCLAVFLALTPVWLGLTIQELSHAPDLNPSQYAASEVVMILPKIIEMVLLCYALHIALDNKFLAHGVAIVLFAGLFALQDFNYFDYWLLLYSYAPRIWASDMDGIGHMVRPILWYQVYWLLAGVVLVLIGSLLFVRGTRSSVREKMMLAVERFRGVTRWGIVGVLVAMAAAGGYIYYNVSYLNEYLTPWERAERAATGEKVMKRYASLPIPQLTRAILQVDLYPDRQRAETRAMCTIANKGGVRIDSLLVDGGDYDYDLYFNGRPMAYTCPLYFPRGKFSWFRPRLEASDYRMYKLPVALAPGDTMVVGVRSVLAHQGFENSLFAANLLRNGTINNGNLPGLGYDEGEEIGSNDKRKEHGLPEKYVHPPAPDDAVGRMQPRNGFNADLISTDITVSTAGDQWAVVPGRLLREWKEHGRHYFRYVQDDPKTYMPYAIFSARYAVISDTVQLAGGHVVPVGIYYHPVHGRNLNSVKDGVKDALHYLSAVLRPYPFPGLSFAETVPYGPFAISLPGVIGMSEARAGWVADLRGGKMPDYLYYNAVQQTVGQWWGRQVIASKTAGAAVIEEAIPQYEALRLMERKYGKLAASYLFDRIRNDYRWVRHDLGDGEPPLLTCEWNNHASSKGTMVLYGIAEMMGEDSVNAALADLMRGWAFRNGGPYAGAGDLYAALKAHTPDSLLYYVRDCWEKAALYNNAIRDIEVTPGSRKGFWRVRVRFSVEKTYRGAKGDEEMVKDMNDLVDIGIYGKASGFGVPSELVLHTARYGAGVHVLEVEVSERPTSVRVDPRHKLIDIREDDNERRVDGGK